MRKPVTSLPAFIVYLQRYLECASGPPGALFNWCSTLVEPHSGLPGPNGPIRPIRRLFENVHGTSDDENGDDQREYFLQHHRELGPWLYGETSVGLNAVAAVNERWK